MDFKPFRKSQAALEFLTTYGWAFLVILIMIGTLAYFGILNPSKLLPNRCTFGSEFQCLDYAIINGPAPTGDDSLDLRLKNGGGELIDVSSIILSREDGVEYDTSAATGCTTATVTTIDNWVLAGTQDLQWAGCTFADLAAGQKGKMLVTIRFNTEASGPTYTREVKGEIFTNILSS